MVNEPGGIWGPLAGLECLRGVSRGWIVLVRTLAAAAILGATMVIVWWCWLEQKLDPSFQPYELFRGGLIVVEGMLTTIALVLTPSVLAGSLAGEKERGALGLLLTTRVTPREIVTARMAGKIAQVLMILLAGLPALILFAALAGFRPRVVLCLVALPASVVLGSGGLATAVSAVSRRGRDALLTVYLMEMVVLISPVATAFGVSLGLLDWIAAASPFSGLGPLIRQEDVGPALASIGIWVATGLAGAAVATWRLAPDCLAHLDGVRLGRRGSSRRAVPALDERPMLWKELYIERMGTLGGLGWWLGAGLTILLAVGSVALAAVIAWDVWNGGDRGWSDWARWVLSLFVGQTGRYVSWLIAWAIGLRAAVAIASERERGCWDSILISPLEGREIVRAKLWGCVYALRWLFAAALLAWTIAAASDAITPTHYAGWVIGTVLGGIFMGAVGLRASLACGTATRAMAVTMGGWLLGQAAFQAIAMVVGGMAGIFYFLGASALTDMPPGAIMMNVGRVSRITWLVTLNVCYGLASLVLIAYSRVLFDRLAGRRTGGRIAAKAEQLIHGDVPGPMTGRIATPVAEGTLPSPPALSGTDASRVVTRG